MAFEGKPMKSNFYWRQSTFDNVFCTFRHTTVRCYFQRLFTNNLFAVLSVVFAVSWIFLRFRVQEIVLWAESRCTTQCWNHRISPLLRGELLTFILILMAALYGQIGDGLIRKICHCWFDEIMPLLGFPQRWMEWCPSCRTDVPANRMASLIGDFFIRELTLAWVVPEFGLMWAYPVLPGNQRLWVTYPEQIMLVSDCS